MASPSGAQPPARVALVTGANRGIGRAIADGLAHGGLTVLFTARQPEQAAAAAAPLAGQGRPVASHALDVTDPASVAAIAAWVAAQYGRLDVLVNNAGAYYDDDQETVSADLAIVQAALDVNLLGPWRLCEAFVPLMLQHGYGRIVNVSSGGGSFATAGAGTPAYSVSKAGLNMLTVKLAAELAGSGVLVNAACPGWVRTAMGSPAAPRSPEEGADTPLWLATLAANGPNGGFFRDRQRIPW
jgi:NAD(P)-dependent dehydrogenase (short-subunit alcohol dehydrogenase family)